TYNLRGGTLAANTILGPQANNGAGSSAAVNFNGGTLQALAAGSLMPANANLTATIQAGGVTVDTNGKSVSIDQPLLAPSGYGIGSIALTGTGTYTVAPYVQCMGGSGSGATGQALLGSGGTISQIIVTNPGSGYSLGDAVTVDLISNQTNGLSGGTATGIATAALTATPLVDGGLTKTGSGTLTLTAVNTYNGGTTISAGNLVLGSSAGLSDGPIAVHSGARFAPQPGTGGTIVAGVGNASLTIASGAFFDMSGDGAAGAFQVNGTGTALTLSGGALGFDVGSSGNDQLLIAGGSASVSGANTISILPLSSSLVAGAYTVIADAAGGLQGGSFVLSNSAYAVGSTIYGLSLLNSSTAEQVQVSVLKTNASFDWAGLAGGDAKWTTAANWNNSVPGPGAVALFSDPSATASTIDLGAGNVTVAGLTFSGNQNINITATDPSHPMLILDGSATGGTAAITVTGTQSIGAPLQFNSNVAVTTTNPTDSLIVGSNVSQNWQGGYALTKNGNGTLTFNGNVSLSNYACVSNSGTLTFNGNASLSSGTLNGGVLTFNGNTNMSNCVSNTGTLTFNGNVSLRLHCGGRQRRQRWSGGQCRPGRVQ
ncbi:MAG: beta strand repeat-containing protein, partial [Thermoguttaceae bacterium]